MGITLTFKAAGFSKLGKLVESLDSVTVTERNKFDWEIKIRDSNGTSTGFSKSKNSSQIVPTAKMKSTGGTTASYNIDNGTQKNKFQLIETPNQLAALARSGIFIPKSSDLGAIVAMEQFGRFGSDNRAGIERQLHRISAIRNREKMRSSRSNQQAMAWFHCLPFWLAVQCFVTMADAISLGLKPTSVEPTTKITMTTTTDTCSSRRGCLFGLGGLAGGLVLATRPAHATRGAFELDSEYYIRDLLGGNKKEGNILPSQPPAMPPPRTLMGPLIPLLLDSSYATSCIPVQALVEQLKGDNEEMAKKIAATAMDYRTKASRSFSSLRKWDTESVTDQYYFDISAYALWKTAADVLPNYAERDKFARTVGRRLYTSTQPKDKQQSTTSSSASLMASEAEMVSLLRLFQDSNFCKGFKITGSDPSVDYNSNKKKEEQDLVFDKLDDEALLSGASVDCLVSVYEPATLGASLQITGEQSRFAPDYVGATLAAMWESKGIKSSWEVFFVDPEYRPNPKDYYPNEKLLQFTLTLA